MREALSLFPLAGIITGAAVVFESQVLGTAEANIVNTNNVISAKSCYGDRSPYEQLILLEAVLPPETNIRANYTVEIPS